MSGFAQSRRGGPLAMLGLVMAAWISGRMMLWESPFGVAEALSTSVGEPLAEAPQDETNDERSDKKPRSEVRLTTRPDTEFRGHFAAAQTSPEFPAGDFFTSRPGIAAGHQMLLMAAMGYVPMPRVIEETWRMPAGPSGFTQDAPGAGWSLPTGTKIRRKAEAKPDRWSVDAWAFWRQGSNSAQISQGRVPVYGASQAGAVLQYRFAPSSGHDPRGYLRGYRALVRNGESEAALGVSARPLGGVPVRLHGEARLTDGQSRTEIRGAAYATTEIPPIKLPLGAQAEAYAQGGYVSGESATAFVDGQLQLTRELARFDLAKSKTARFSVGGGAWAGAQEDVNRVDLGPTARVDMAIGQVPARISVDWRERVAGDAAPSSGVAVTISARF